MIQIHAENIGKRFGRNWIFKNLDYTFEAGNSYAITGSNGSGKTTFIRSLAGILPLSKGKISYHLDQSEIHPDDIHKYLSLSGPYTEVIEEFSLLELIHFYQNFKPLQVTPEELIEIMELKHSKKKAIKDFSSGMKQKLKLGLAFFGFDQILILDEPTSNLDHQNIEWYHQQIENIDRSNKIILICSNQPYEYDFCTNHLNISHFK
ncbi:ABC transporter ATP-binding protein [Sediminitomix flava]|uniref:ABC-type multidrug transport system ATPase subunit n=1 Tax=Sediminitomix flava TaxID=379075 RepID=A0A315ZIZ8_SEDFL|nr:ATP-binding cassette domain-containing protein [Sediminitomix flava]PWJ44808.1 ABC-type multidrug transport system ATPase subunit [Sediminitomix flava]